MQLLHCYASGVYCNTSVVAKIVLVLTGLLMYNSQTMVKQLQSTEIRSYLTLHVVESNVFNDKEAKDKAELEMSRISLKLEDISFTTPQKSEENRRLGEEIAEESKSQVAKMMIFVKEDFH